jgi:signal transduction histidine kinase
VTLLLDDDERPDPGWGAGRSSLGLGLNMVGVVVVAGWLVVDGIRLGSAAWVYAVAAVALAAWAVRQLARRRGLLIPASIVMVLAGAVVTEPTKSLLIVPTIIGVVQLGADRRLPIWVGAVAAVLGEVIIAGGTALDGGTIDFVFGTAAGLLLGVLIGLNRRQFRVAEARRRQVEDEQQRSELAADRARAARDIHDVLAHSLGGLVLQLDAVEALLEAGRTDEAATRASDARALAADGLAEARRAVAALRDPEEAGAAPTDGVTGTPGAHRASRPDADAAAPAAAASAAGGLAALVDAHRSFGGSIDTQGDLALPDLDDAHAAAVVAAAREALSNARRHAVGSGVSLSVIRDGDAVDVVIANPLATGGHGLIGMRERFAELGDGSTIEAERSDGEFVVAMHVLAAVDADPADDAPVGDEPSRRAGSPA